MCGRWGEVVVGEYEIQQRKKYCVTKKKRSYLSHTWDWQEKKTFLQVSVWHIFLLLLISRYWWLGGIDVYSTVVQKKSRKNTSKGLGEERRFFHISSWSNSACASLFVFVWEIYAFQVCTKELSGCFGEAMALFVLRLKKPVWETVAFFYFPSSPLRAVSEWWWWCLGAGEIPPRASWPFPAGLPRRSGINFKNKHVNSHFLKMEKNGKFETHVYGVVGHLGLP